MKKLKKLNTSNFARFLCFFVSLSLESRKVLLEEVLCSWIWWVRLKLERKHSSIVIKTIPEDSFPNLVLNLFDTSFAKFTFKQLMLEKTVSCQNYLLVVILVESVDLRLCRHVTFMFFVTNGSWDVELSIDPVFISSLEDKSSLGHDFCNFWLVWQIMFSR